MKRNNTNKTTEQFDNEVVIIAHQIFIAARYAK
jgi:hypothetical protein